MSDVIHSNDTPPPARPTWLRMSLWGLLFAVLMLLFAIVTVVAMALPRPRSLQSAEAARRQALLQAQAATPADQAKEKAQLDSYGWVDKKNQKAYIPIRKAMEEYVTPAKTPSAPHGE